MRQHEVVAAFGVEGDFARAELLDKGFAVGAGAEDEGGAVVGVAVVVVQGVAVFCADDVADAAVFADVAPGGAQGVSQCPADGGEVADVGGFGVVGPPCWSSASAGS